MNTISEKTIYFGPRSESAGPDKFPKRFATQFGHITIREYHKMMKHRFSGRACTITAKEKNACIFNQAVNYI